MLLAQPTTTLDQERQSLHEKAFERIASWLCWDFWYAHPVVAWALELAVATPLFLLVTVCVFSDSKEVETVGFVMAGVTEYIFKKLRNTHEVRSRLRRTPFFFFC